MKLLLVIITSIFLNSCNLKFILNENTRSVSPRNIASVGILITRYQVDIEKFIEQCLMYYDDVTCHNEDMILAIDNINTQLNTSFTTKSTTFAIENEENQPIMITAGHVCSEFNYINEFVIQAISAFAFGPMNQFSLETKKIILVYDIFGNEYTYINTIYTNPTKPDLCLYFIDKRFPSTISLSHSSPELGDNISNIAVPFGIFGNRAIPIFQGIYSGTRENNHIYSIPAGPGSSGSPVLLNNKLIGIIHSVDRRIGQISYGTPLDFIRDVIELE